MLITGLRLDFQKVRVSPEPLSSQKIDSMLFQIDFAFVVVELKTAHEYELCPFYSYRKFHVNAMHARAPTIVGHGYGYGASFCKERRGLMAGRDIYDVYSFGCSESYNAVHNGPAGAKALKPRIEHYPIQPSPRGVIANETKGSCNLAVNETELVTSWVGVKKPGIVSAFIRCEVLRAVGIEEIDARLPVLTRVGPESHFGFHWSTARIS